MERTYTVEVIVTEEDTSFVHAVSDDEVTFDDLPRIYERLTVASYQEVKKGRNDLES